VLRWIAETLRPSSRSYPVFRRYLEQIAGRVQGFGGDPTQILPSPTGEVPAMGTGQPVVGAVEITGKVEGIIYDHFGDFEGFILELRDGEHLRFASREHEILRLVQRAWAERIVVTVMVRKAHANVPVGLVLRGAPPRFEH
jgi:hypothetical protein